MRVCARTYTIYIKDLRNSKNARIHQQLYLLYQSKDVFVGQVPSGKLYFILTKPGRGGEEMTYSYCY